jgi:hypothetical protein
VLFRSGLFLSTPRGVFIGKVIRPARPTAQALRGLPVGFDPSAYIEANPDVAAAGMSAEEHYKRFGWHEGRRLKP